MFNWLMNLLKKFWRAPDLPVDPKPAPDPALEEVVATSGKYFEREVGPTGVITFEVFVPEAGRIDDWGDHGAEIFAIYDSKRATKGNLYALLPYKIKACSGGTCGSEPRYNLPWDTWRKIRFEWNLSEFKVTIDHVTVSKKIPLAWSAPMRAIYGCVGDNRHPCGHLIEGVKWRNFKWEE